MKVEFIESYIKLDNGDYQWSDNHGELIRCEECKNRYTLDCPMYFEEWIQIDDSDDYIDTDYIVHDQTTDDGYCHRGERE